MTVVVRQAMADDTGLFTDGTAVDEAFVDQVYGQIDDQAHSTTNPTIKPKAIIDEVVTARGSKASLDARLDISLNEDGTPKAVAGQATETQVSRTQGEFNLVSNGEMEFWDNGAALAPRGWVLAGAGAAVARTGVGEADTVIVDAGQYASKVTSGGATPTLTNSIIPTAQFTRWGNIKGRKIAVSAQVRALTAALVRIVVDDGVTTTASSFHAGSGAIETLTVLHTISATGTKLNVYMEVTGGVGQLGYIGGVASVFSDVGQTNWIPSSTRGARIERFGGFPNAANGTTVETDLFLWSIPPLDIDGEGVEFRCSGSLANNTNIKTLRLDIAGQKLVVITSSAASASNVFTVGLSILRVSATVVDVAGVVTFNGASGAAPTVWHIRTTITALDMTRTQACKITGQSNTASSDITLRSVSGLIDRN